MYLLGACATISRIFEYQPKIVNDGTKRVDYDRNNGEISIDHVHFTYPTKKDAKVLKDIQIDI